MSYTSVAFQLAHASRASSKSPITLPVPAHYRAQFGTRVGDHTEIRFPRLLRGSGHRLCGSPGSCGSYSSAGAKLADVNDNPKRQRSLMSLQGSAKLVPQLKGDDLTAGTCRCAVLAAIQIRGRSRTEGCEEDFSPRQTISYLTASGAASRHG